MTIGVYETVRLLGKGGMSQVYEVENRRLGSRHALKLYSYEKDDAEVRDRFLVEGRLLARLNHPRIVKVTDFGTDEASGRPYFVMDLVLNARGEMQLLSDVEPGMVDEETVGRWHDDLREGLAYIHANGVVHRDLKLQNVLIGPDGHAVLADFGISKVFGSREDGTKLVDAVHTVAKLQKGRRLVMGSVGYMAPELEMGVEASPQSDYYALGVIVYRLLTGTWCDSRTDVVRTLETYEPAWSRIIPKLLHSNPDARECLSFADEHRTQRELQELRRETDLLRAEKRAKFAVRFLCAGLALLAVGAAVASAAIFMLNVRIRQVEESARLAGINFCDVFEVPEDPPTDSDSELNLEDYAEIWAQSHVAIGLARRGDEKSRKRALKILGDEKKVYEEEGLEDDLRAACYGRAISNLVNGVVR